MRPPDVVDALQKNDDGDTRPRQYIPIEAGKYIYGL